MDWFWFLVIGLAAGWLAGQIMRDDTSSMVNNLIVGVIGSLLGGFLFGLIGLESSSLRGNLVTATIGAIALIAGLRALSRRGT